MLALTQTTPPTIEPVTRAEAMSFARITTSAENDLADRLIKAARGVIESLTGYQLLPATWTWLLDAFPTSHRPERDESSPLVTKIRVSELIVPRPPLQTVTSIKYVDIDGAQQTLATSEYDVDTNGEPGRITLALDKSWPAIRRQKHAVEVIFVAGYADVASVPDEVKLATLIGVADLYDHRGVSRRDPTTSSLTDNQRLLDLISDLRTVGGV